MAAKEVRMKARAADAKKRLRTHRHQNRKKPPQRNALQGLSFEVI